MVVAALLAHRSASARHIGVLWDLATFWPRTAHPLAPPCYAERAVPEISRRIGYLTSRDGRVVLSGHSHGAVLPAAVVLQLPRAWLDRVALLTHANPLCRLYSRVFPAHFGPATLQDIGDRVGWRWLNLWRDTDWIGGPVFSPDCTGPAGGMDRRQRDPEGLLTPPQDTVPPPIRGHRFDPDEHTGRRSAT